MFFIFHPHFDRFLQASSNFQLVFRFIFLGKFMLFSFYIQFFLEPKSRAFHDLVAKQFCSNFYSTKKYIDKTFFSFFFNTRKIFLFFLHLFSVFPPDDLTHHSGMVLFYFLKKRSTGRQKKSLIFLQLIEKVDEPIAAHCELCLSILTL